MIMAEARWVLGNQDLAGKFSFNVHLNKLVLIRPHLKTTFRQDPREVVAYGDVADNGHDMI